MTRLVIAEKIFDDLDVVDGGGGGGDGADLESSVAAVFLRFDRGDFLATIISWSKQLSNVLEKRHNSKEN